MAATSACKREGTARREPSMPSPRCKPHRGTNHVAHIRHRSGSVLGASPFPQTSHELQQRAHSTPKSVVHLLHAPDSRYTDQATPRPSTTRRTQL